MTIKEVHELIMIIICIVFLTLLATLIAYCITTDIIAGRKEKKETQQKVLEEKIEENVDYKVQNEMLKKEIEEYKRLIKNKEAAFKKAYSDLIQEKIDKRDWEYLGGKKK